MPQPAVSLRHDVAPAIAVTGFFVAWPQARRWNESPERFFNEENSDDVLRAMARGDWNASGHSLKRSSADAVRAATLRAADEAARVLATRGAHFDATRCAVVFSSSKGELDLLPAWAARETENSLPVGNAIIATSKAPDVRAPGENQFRSDFAAQPNPDSFESHLASTREYSRAAISSGEAHTTLSAPPENAAPREGETNRTRAFRVAASTREETAGDDFLLWTPDAPARVLARHLGARGAVLSPVAACAGGAHAVQIGAQLIEDGRADFAVCGALEAGLTPLMMAGYQSLGALSKSGAMRPFDGARDGFVPREGLAMLVLENADIARKRGARVLATLSGAAMNADATSMTAMQPDGNSVARAIEIALRKADVRRKLSVGYINAHATATKLNDQLEARAIAQTLGESVAVGATKGATGHWLGAAGALEAVLCVLSLREGFLPPCVGLSRRGDGIAPLDFLVGGGRETRVQRALSLSYGFGGHIGALVFDAA